MPFKILSLDGGGSWALLQVMALRYIYSGSSTGHQILKDFDLVAANSGGAITLGGLIENKSLDDLLDKFYLSQEIRNKIFVKAGFFQDPKEVAFHELTGFGPQYIAKDKLIGLQEILTAHGNDQLWSIPSQIAAHVGKCPHFLITAFDFDRKRACFFRSNTHSLASSASPPPNVTLAQAIHASSNAPVNFFDAPAQFSNRQFWDGAIAGYNNPILAAVTEALANNVSPSDIIALSIGTGNRYLPITDRTDTNSDLLQQPEKSGIFHDLRELAGCILDDPPDAASFISYVALGQKLPGPNQTAPVCGNLVRLNPLIQPVQISPGAPWSLPAGINDDQFHALLDLQMDAITKDDVDLISAFGKAWLADAVPNQPIRSNSQTLHCEIGHARFTEGAKYWKSLCKN